MSNGSPPANLPDNTTAKDPPAGLHSDELAPYWLAAIIESAEDAIITKTLEGVITSWNPGAQRLFGYTAEEVIGKSVTILFPPDHIDEEPAILARIRAGERVEHYETVRCRKDGSLIDISLTVSPIRKRDGTIIGASKIARDITEQKRSQERLRAQAEVIAQAYDAIFLRDSSNAITLWNSGAERTYGYTQEEALGRSPHELLETVPPVSLEEIYASLRRAGYWEGELLHTRKDGEQIVVESRWATVRDARGQITSILEITRDITERKRAEEERERLLASEQRARASAEESSRLKNEFLATVSHELRTPLTAIVGWATMLRTNNLDKDNTAKALETIERNARAQTQLIEDLMDVSRIITGKLRLDVQQVNPAPLVEAAIDVVRPAADAKNIRLQMVLDPLAGPVSGDPVRLQQVIWNLLSNAVKFTPKGGRVQVGLGRVNSHVEISVSDNGAGITPEFLPHVFDRFRQADQRITRQHGGLGLGLAIVRHLVELHGGTVRAESAGSGQGATFTVLLPVAPVYRGVGAEERVHPAAKDTLPSYDCADKLDGIKVLVVDDEPDTRELLKVGLGQCGAIVMTAGSVGEALEAMARAVPDVLISDIGMPEEDGYELIRRVRELPAESGGRVPAIALTAYARVEDRMQALRAGYQMHVPKPVELAELVTVAASLVRRVN
jgi:PAS domain S-box-containing protein